MEAAAGRGRKKNDECFLAAGVGCVCVCVCACACACVCVRVRVRAVQPGKNATSVRWWRVVAEINNNSDVRERETHKKAAAGGDWRRGNDQRRGVFVLQRGRVCSSNGS